ncbi:hypothetical protein E2C01_060222 [Portunus trituberculatus]|uniref:Uncharacterized protein n=1 Tax=Portunus trituberculatus TaxID=210409 RepID=A0A5B7H8A6_PORTR|nr:hypothetical protein [Portunus trituberculatus]
MHRSGEASMSVVFLCGFCDGSARVAGPECRGKYATLLTRLLNGLEFPISVKEDHKLKAAANTTVL